MTMEPCTRQGSLQHWLWWGSTIAVVALVLANPELKAQWTEGRFDSEVALGYRYTAASGFDNGFTLTGGTVSVSHQMRGWLGNVIEASDSHANAASAGETSFKLITLVTGPRVSLTERSVKLFGELLGGVARGNETYLPTEAGYATSATSYAIQAGGGVDFLLQDRFSIRVVDVEHLSTGFAEGARTAQQHWTVGGGLVWRFGLPKRPVVERAVTPWSEIFFTCGTDTPSVVAGQTIEVLGHAETVPDLIALQYSWSATGGTLVGAGRQMYLKTNGLRDGDYRVHGRASLVSNPATSKDCEFAVHVTSRTAAP